MAGNPSLGEVTVLGAGPAGLAIAVELGQRGAPVTVCAPDPHSPWPASYGTFETLLPAEYSTAISHKFTQPRWVDRTGRPFGLESSYVRLDTDRLQSLLLERAQRHGVRFERTEGDVSRATDKTRLCIVATGRDPDARQQVRYQTAYGVWAKLPRDVLLPGEMIFMDLSGPRSEGPPSFLYATREGAAHFLQETVLVSSDKPTFESLKDRLIARLAARGLSLGEELREERCSIAMGGPPLPGRDNLVHFGARAGLTHPATGYQLARCLRLAGPLAELICRKAPANAPDVARAARAQLWTWDRRLRWVLFNYGAETLSRFDHDEFGRFMEVFLSMPARELTSFIDGQLRLSATLGLMARSFRRSDPEIRRRLAGLRSSARLLAPS